ncbi:MAG: tRNA guanosine(34) transglycosylase Tgt [Gammaproteobacteria bacterium]|nr:tRNA guanosine(34) transglycosylase Tgt [Gammaproteobacteria bacterium]
MSNPAFNTQLIARHPRLAARVMKTTTPHGEFLTPHFMPVGTRAFLNYLTPADLVQTDSQIILGGNTYHMLLSPGLEVIQALGGMHKMMNWSGAMLTDSGGYQVFSLSKNSKICQINEEGARFKHPINGQIIHLTPHSSLEAQKVIGADIIMAFDQCTPDTLDKALVQGAMDRTHRWLLQSKAYQEKHPHSVYGFPQALFGIIQGSYFRDLREESARFVTSLDLDGIAIGGETIGYDMQKTVEIIQWVQPYLPQDKLRYTMGVGLSPQDLIDVVAEGIDMFDCVAPTRNARHGALYHGHLIEENGWLRFESDMENARIQIKKSLYAKEDQPILNGCTCYTCQHHSRGYLHYLFKTQSLAFSHLACIHNIHVMQHTCQTMQKLILGH